MSALHPRPLPTRLIAGVVLSLVALSPALAAVGTSDAQTRYEQERARCLSGMSNQDRATCLKEAVNAFDAAKHGRLDVGDANYQRNAQARCDALQGDDARDCRARMNGAGTTRGSVEAGGIYRELVTRFIKPEDAAPPEPPALAPQTLPPIPPR